ncbi:hypothetical protein CsSME_00037295 [Camellia sinensis var. sinensis]
MGHRKAFMVVPLWVIGNVSLFVYGSSECLHGSPFVGIGFHVKCMNFEYEYEYVCESVSVLTFDYVSRRVTKPKLLSRVFVLSACCCASSRGSLLVGLGCDKVVSEHNLYRTHETICLCLLLFCLPITMENARNDDAVGSSEARMSRMERMLIALTESLRQQPMPPPLLPAETWLLEMEKLYEVFPSSEIHKEGLTLEVFDRVSVLKLLTYVEVLDRALMVEATLAAMKQRKAPTTKK